MTVFRWIIGVLSATLGAGALLSFLLFLALDINLWLERARALRRVTWLALLLWFNVEVWGRVIWTLIHW